MDYRAQIYGVFILWIVLFHAYAIDGVDYTFGFSSLGWLSDILNRGRVGVDGFFFLSGISLYYSWSRDPDIKDYMTKRLVRLFVPVILVDGLYWLIRCVILGQLGGAAGFIRRITLTSFFFTGDEQVWYVSILLVLYILYPFIYAFLFSDENRKKTALKAVILLALSYILILTFKSAAPDLFDMVEIGITRIPVFLLGACLGRIMSKGFKVTVWWGLVPIAGTVLFFAVLNHVSLPNPYNRFFYLVGGVCLTYVFAFIFYGLDRFSKKRNGRTNPVLRFFAFLGNSSLEIYLAHIMFNQIYRLTPIYVEGSLLRYMVMALAAVAFALAVHAYGVRPLSKWLMGKLLKKKEN